jgi:PEP-CTERM motif
VIVNRAFWNWLIEEIASAFLRSSSLALRFTVLLAACEVAAVASANPATLRIVSYNIDSQDQNSDNNITQNTGSTAHSIPTVIQAIGNHHIGGNAQQVDVLGLEELRTVETGGANATLTNLTTELNKIYGAGTYNFNTSDPTQSDGLIYNTKTVQIVSARALSTGANVLLQSYGTYTAAHHIQSASGVARSPLVFQLRPVGFQSNSDFYMYVSHAVDGSDNSVGDDRYEEAQEVRSDAKYNLPGGAHIIYSGDWNLFNGSDENAYKCLTGQVTSDNINWADASSVWANSNATQAFDPTSKSSPPTTTTFHNSASDGSATYLYTEQTQPGSFTNSSRLDIQLVNSPTLNQPGLQLARDTMDSFDTLNFPSSQYPYAFEVFGNNGSTPRGAVATNSNNNSLADLANVTTVLGDIQQFGSGSTSTGSDHYPIVGDYFILRVGGDYNGNGIVDAADYTVWRDESGHSGAGLAADGTGPGGAPDGVVDQLDYDLWKANFGNHAGAGASTNTAVPEPATLWMLLAGILTMCCRRRTRVS